MTMSHFDSLEGFGERTNLVNFDKNRVGSTHADTFLQELNVGNEQVVSYKLATVSDGSGKLNPVVPVVLVETVLD